MLVSEKFLYHTTLSAYINCGLLDSLDVCPFNALYSDFLIRNEDKLKGNPRLG